MNKKYLLVKYDKDLRIHRMFPEARREVNGSIVRFVRVAPGMNFVSFSFATERQLDYVIEQQVKYFEPMNQPLTWKFYEHDLPRGMDEKLSVNNFVADSEPADVMIFDAQSHSIHAHEVPGMDVSRVQCKDELKDVIHVLDTVYGNDNSWVYSRLGLHLRIPGYLSVYVAYLHEQPVSVAWTYFPAGHFATLFGGSTIEVYRGKGIYANLLATRLNEIHRRGYPFAVVEAGAMSRPIVEKQGFQHLTTVWDFELKPDNYLTLRTNSVN